MRSIVIGIVIVIVIVIVMVIVISNSALKHTWVIHHIATYYSIYQHML